MSNLVPGITFSLSSLCDFSRPSLASEIVRNLCEVPSSIRPSRFGPFEGTSPIDDLDGPVGFLAQPMGGKPADAASLVLAASKNCEYQVQWNKSSPPSFAFVGGFLLCNAFNKRSDVLTAFLGIAKRLASTVNTVYGDIRSMEFPGWDTPFNLSVRLPDIPNISIYGKPYIDYFGRDRIESAPFYCIERLSDNHYWLQATELVTDPVPDDVRIAVREHLGKDAFMSGKKWRYGDGMHPEFDFSEVTP